MAVRITSLQRLQSDNGCNKGRQEEELPESGRLVEDEVWESTPHHIIPINHNGMEFSAG